MVKPPKNQNKAVKLTPNVFSVSLYDLQITTLKPSTPLIISLFPCLFFNTSFITTKLSFLGLGIITLHCMLINYSRRKLDFLDLVKTLCRKSADPAT